MTDKVKLNLGCGRKKIPGFVNIDCRESVGGVEPDQCFDLTSFPWPYEDNSVSEVRASDFLEHIPIGQTVAVIEEIYRILVPSGIFLHYTPSTDGRGAFMDPTHVSFWNILSWKYYMEDAYRELYDIKAKFKGINQNVDSGDGVVHVFGELMKV